MHLVNVSGNLFNDFIKLSIKMWQQLVSMGKLCYKKLFLDTENRI